MEAFEQHPAKNGLLILGGAYWPTKPGIKSWVLQKAKQSDKNITVVYENDLENYFEQTNSRCAA